MGAPGVTSINGVEFDSSSVSITIDSKYAISVTAINYDRGLEGVTKVFAYGQVAPRGRTRGKYQTNGSMECYSGDAEIIKQYLYGKGGATARAGIYEIEFDLVITLFEPTRQVNKTILQQCRITKDAFTGPSVDGGDPIKTAFDLNFMRCIENGRPDVSER